MSLVIEDTSAVEKGRLFLAPLIFRDNRVLFRRENSIYIYRAIAHVAYKNLE